MIIVKTEKTKRSIIKKYKRIYFIFSVVVFFIQFISPSILRKFLDFDSEMTFRSVASFSFIFVFTSVWIVILFISELNTEDD